MTSKRTVDEGRNEHSTAMTNYGIGDDVQWSWERSVYQGLGIGDLRAVDRERDEWLADVQRGRFRHAPIARVVEDEMITNEDRGTFRRLTVRWTGVDVSGHFAEYRTMVLLADDTVRLAPPAIVATDS